MADNIKYIQPFMGKQPRWTDECLHGLDCFIGRLDVTYATAEGGTRKETMDVYVFDSHMMGAELCIRYGSKPNEYISPGRVIDVAMMQNNGLYKAAMDMVKSAGLLRFSRRE